MVAVSILGLLGLVEIFEDGCFSYNVGWLQRTMIESMEAGDVLTLVLAGEVSALAQLQRGLLTIGFDP